MEAIRPLANTISVTAANLVSNARMMYVYATANSLVSIGNATATWSSITMPGGSTLFIEKTPTEYLSSNVAVLVTPVAYR
jgi:hypothetical protein